VRARIGEGSYIHRVLQTLQSRQVVPAVSAERARAGWAAGPWGHAGTVELHLRAKGWDQ
jgi:hypothetical protein